MAKIVNFAIFSHFWPKNRQFFGKILEETQKGQKGAYFWDYMTAGENVEHILWFPTFRAFSGFQF